MKKLGLILTILFFLVTVCILLFFHLRGFIPYDDGWFLQGGLRLLDGERIYKDFQYLYNPASLYVNALAFLIFGKSILASRIFALLNSLLSVGLIYWIGKKLKLNLLIIFALIFAYVFWAPGHVNFVWPVIFCLTTALGSGIFFTKGFENKKKNLPLFLTGALSAITFLFKQNFGLAIVIADAFVIIFIKEFRKTKLIFWHIFGYITIITLQVLYFLFTGSFSSYLKEIYYFTVIKIYQQGIFNSGLPWDYPAPFLVKAMKVILYALPLLISLFSILKIYKNKKKYLLYFPFVSLAFYGLSIRPTTDYIHLTPLIAISLIPLAIVYKDFKNLWGKYLSLSLILVLMFFGLYSSLFRNYYRWNTPLIKENVFVNNPKVLIWTDDKNSLVINKITQYFKTNAKNEKYTFVYDFDPVFYLILDKKNPTPYDYLHPGVTSVDIQKEIIKTLTDKKIKHILTNTDIKNNSSPLPYFIKTKYKPVYTTYEYIIWQFK